jgi:hypothetical protein
MYDVLVDIDLDGDVEALTRTSLGVRKCTVFRE